MRTLLSACLLWTLLRPAVSLKCNTCIQLGQNLCLSPYHKGCITMMNACMSSVVDTNIFGAHRRIPQMGCRNSHLHRTANYSFTSREKSFLVDIQICQKDFCNNVPPLLVPPRAPNGMQCPGCFAPDRDACNAVETVICPNKEYKCIDFAGNISQFFFGNIKVAFQGCATKDFCDYVMGKQANNLFTATATRMHCVDAKPSASKPGIKE